MSPVLFIVLMVLVPIIIGSIFNGMELFMNLCMLGVKLIGNIIGVVLVIYLISLNIL